MTMGNTFDSESFRKSIKKVKGLDDRQLQMLYTSQLDQMLEYCADQYMKNEYLFALIFLGLKHATDLQAQISELPKGTVQVVLKDLIEIGMACVMESVLKKKGVFES